MLRYGKLIVWMLIPLIIVSCKDDDDPIVEPPVDSTEISALPETVPQRVDNPSSLEKIELGRSLFYDPILSGNMDVACATCHHPEFGYADGIDLSIGVGGEGLGLERNVGVLGFAGRNAPTVINAAFNGIDVSGQVDAATAPMFWDKRVMSLEEQALKPIHSLVEMRGDVYTEDATMGVIVDRLEAIPEYRTLFQNVFGSEGITAQNVVRAIAVFERSIIANNSPFDQYMRGDLNALTELQLEGMQDFIDVGCNNCHNGPMLSDYQLHVLGMRENDKLSDIDQGDGTFAFRTPTLRNLDFTAPYMHNGEFVSLRQVLNFYNLNNASSDNPNISDDQLDEDFKELEEIDQIKSIRIIEFLRSLNDPNFDRTIPVSVPSNLNPGGNI